MHLWRRTLATLRLAALIFCAVVPLLVAIDLLDPDPSVRPYPTSEQTP